MKFTCSHSGVNDLVVGPSPQIMALLRAKFLNGYYLINSYFLNIKYVCLLKRADILYLSASWRRSNH